MKDQNNDDDNAMNEIIETINAMKKQELASYQTKCGIYDQSTRIDGKCRRIIVAWFKQIASYYNFRDCTVAVAVNILDRFVAEHSEELLASKTAKAKFRLVSLVCLYTAVKSHEQVVLDSKSISKLSQGLFSPQKIEKMELRIITTLDWRINPPTAFAFADMYLKLSLPLVIVNDGDETHQQAAVTTMIEKLVKYQIDYAIENCQFLGMAASELAFTATYNATMATLGRRYSLPYENIQKLIDVKLLPFQLENELWNHVVVLVQQKYIINNKHPFDTNDLVDNVAALSLSVVKHPLIEENHKTKGVLLRRSFVPNYQQFSPRCITIS